jgi:Ran GTPase-activating protein (RanGAP) involved in mRNA processing and transport
MVVLSEIIKKNENKYSRLILSKNNFGDKGLELLLDSIQDNNGIVELNLSSNNITAKGGKMLFTYLLTQTSIISLDISSQEGINRNRICCEGVKLIENVLKTNFFIENLDLSSNSIKTEGFKYLVNGLKGNIVLKNLNISNNEIDEKGIFYMNENLVNCKIEVIDLSSNPIGNDGCIAFGKCLGGDQLTEITSVNLSDCSIRFHGIKEFLKNLRKNKKINNLLLDKNNLYSKNWFYLEDYFLNLNLRNLGLSSCSLSMAAAEVSKIFQHHPTLKVLDLSHNQINDSSFIYFKTFPKENLALVEIDLSRNYISDKSAKYFFENLVNNRSLQRLNFFDNQLQNESANAVIESLKLNHFITYINFKANRVPIRIMKEINIRIQNNKIIEKEKFLPQLKREIKDLSFDPEEINSLKGRIILQNHEKEIFIQKLKEDSKIIKMKKLENEKELNKVESESNNILSKIDIISKEIRKIIEMRESEVDNYKVESDKIEENITALTNELEVLKIENFRQQTKYDDINKKNKKIYDNTYKKYEEQRKLLMLEIDQLKSRKKKYVSKLRIVEKLKNSNKDENKVDETNKSINNENLLNQKEHNIVENNTNLNEENKSPSASIEKPKLKKKKNSSSFIRKFEKSRK